MANKKINQLVLKTTIQSTDLFPLGDATTGQLFKKTIAELQAAIGGAVISVNGLVGTVVLDTDDIQELATPTNKYFTDARARGAISLTVSGNSGASTYNSSTGVLNVPTYTLAGLGGITASFLSGASGIAYNSSTGVITYTGTVFTDASIRALVSAGAGLSYNSSTGVFSYSGTVYTDASIRALISLTTSGSSGASTYNNTTGVLNVPTYTLAGLGGITLASLSGSAPITYNSSTGAIGITQASGAANGFLSSTDWTTFNSKQSALTLGNVTEVASNVLMFPDGGTNKTIGNLSIQVVQSGASTNGYLSSTDWNTFNNKQGTITLTTTGTSGAATFSSNTLNIPQYQAVLTNPVTGTGTSGKLVKFTGTSTIGDSILTESGGVITQTAATPDKCINYTDATSFGRIFFSESGTFKAAIQFMGSTFVATARRNALEIVNTTTGDLALGTGDARTFYIKNGGNVGIGTSSPKTISSGLSLTIGDGATAHQPYLALARSATGGWWAGIRWYDGDTIKSFIQEDADFNLRFGTSNTERMRITSGGNVGIGKTNPTVALDVVGYVRTDSRLYANDGTNTLEIGTTYLQAYLTGSAGNTNLDFYTGTSLRMRLTSSGNILMGTSTDNGERLYVSGSIRATGSITANSDARLKKNIERIENALEKVGQISGYTYNTIYDEDRHAGVIAQEIDLVLPEIVNKGNDGLMGVEYGNISALLIEAIKDLKGQNESLKARLTALEK